MQTGDAFCLRGERRCKNTSPLSSNAFGQRRGASAGAAARRSAGGRRARWRRPSPAATRRKVMARPPPPPSGAPPHHRGDLEGRGLLTCGGGPAAPPWRGVPAPPGRVDPWRQPGRSGPTALTWRGILAPPDRIDPRRRRPARSAPSMLTGGGGSLASPRPRRSRHTAVAKLRPGRRSSPALAWMPDGPRRLAAR